jgi:branched-chain amino acid transport system permease protein
MAVLLIALKKTQLGRALRAIAESPKAAALLGIDVEGLFMVTSFVAAGLGGLAGVLIGLYSNALFPLMGQPILHKGIAVIILGGMGDIRGAMFAGCSSDSPKCCRSPTSAPPCAMPSRSGCCSSCCWCARGGCSAVSRNARSDAGTGPDAMLESFDNFWSVYSNLVLSLGTNALLALSIWLTSFLRPARDGERGLHGHRRYTSALLTMNAGAPLPARDRGRHGRAGLRRLPDRQATLRLSGVYLAMATLAFGEVVRIVILNTETWTGGALGLNGIPQSTAWWHVLLAVVVTLAILTRLRRSRVGRAFEAIKEDETAAGLMGIDVDGHKMARLRAGRRDRRPCRHAQCHTDLLHRPRPNSASTAASRSWTMTILGGINSLLGPVLGAASSPCCPSCCAASRTTARRQRVILVDRAVPAQGPVDPALAPAPRRWAHVRRMLKLAAVSRHFGGLRCCRTSRSRCRGASSASSAQRRGKTTVFNLSRACCPPTAGTSVDGAASSGAPHDIYAAGIARTFQNIRKSQGDDAARERHRRHAPPSRLRRAGPALRAARVPRGGAPRPRTRARAAVVDEASITRPTTSRTTSRTARSAGSRSRARSRRSRRCCCSTEPVAGMNSTRSPS